MLQCYINFEHDFVFPIIITWFYMSIFCLQIVIVISCLVARVSCFPCLAWIQSKYSSSRCLHFSSDFFTFRCASIFYFYNDFITIFFVLVTVKISRFFQLLILHPSQPFTRAIYILFTHRLFSILWLIYLYIINSPKNSIKSWLTSCDNAFIKH